jgi:sn-glycerol 3-phosphate transport system permease protein
MRTKNVIFKHPWLPYALIAPQLAITFIFFFWPASQAVYQSVLQQDAFGLKTTFVLFDNFKVLFEDPLYFASVRTTIIFASATTFLSLAISLVLALAADSVIRARTAYQGVLIWPYAVAPAVAGILWWFMFNPTVGILAYVADQLGYKWNHFLNGTDAMILIVVAAAWKQISYNFLFFLAGLQAIPKSLIEAASIDAAGPFKRFWSIVFPLLSPTTFFLLVVNIVFSFFETFSIVHATTSGGPGQSTTILVYKVWRDAFEALDLGGSAAQSVVLMAFVGVLTVIQFRYIERKVEY